VLGTLTLLAATASAQDTKSIEDATTIVDRPLATFVGRRLLVMPSQYLRASDEGLNWLSHVHGERQYLDEVDHEIEFALNERGITGKQWAFPEAIARSAKNNPTLTVDPYALAAQWLRPPTPKRIDRLTEPFASQVRTLVALQESARFALVPVEVRFVREREGDVAKSAQQAPPPDSTVTRGRAVVHLVLVDVRYSKVVAMADVASDAFPTFTPALAASLGSHVADLVVDPLP
jgi:hypothetical protein